jgi:hypothetical protein
MLFVEHICRGDANIVSFSLQNFPVVCLSPSIHFSRACAVCSVLTIGHFFSIKLYFNNMTAFSIFHKPSFDSKIRSTTSSKELAALLASMFAFSSRFKQSSEQGYDPQSQNVNAQALYHSPNHFQTLAQKYVDEELLEYWDKPPSLALLQTLILLTFQQLTTGVRGAAWRRLGLCIRTAYELQLHHLDLDDYTDTDDVGAWCAVEERRRAWWAVWEMDVFASIIKRCPSGIDRGDNETRLPAPDEHWYTGRVFRSCFLEPKPMDRVSTLRESGNESEKAWFLVLNSFMYEGHVMSKYRSAKPGNGRHGPSRGSLKNAVKDVSENLLILANALKCFSLALPKALRYSDEFLSFTSSNPNEISAVRSMHSAKYSIRITTQLTRIMIHHHDAYGGALKDLHLPGSANEDTSNPTTPVPASVSLHLGPTRKGLQQYIDAADEILTVVSRSSDDHIRYVNPFLASTIWYGAAIHLAWKVLAPSNFNQDVIHSKFEVLRMSFEEYTTFWDLPKALQENLQSMEEKLKKFKSHGNTGLAVSRSHSMAKLNRIPAPSVYPMNIVTKSYSTDDAAPTGDDNTSDLHNQYRSSNGGDLTCRSPRSVEEEGRWQTSPKSLDAFNMDSLINVDDIGQLEAPYMNAENLWSDLGLGIDFAIEQQDFGQDFTNYNYTQI